MKKIISIFIFVSFIGSSLQTSIFAQVATFPSTDSPSKEQGILPKPGAMVHLSPAFVPAHIKGITVQKDNALKFDFLIDHGDGNLSAEEKKQEYTKLIKYFLAALTTPDKDQWVNLSPYEKNRMIEDNFGKTVMGRDLLAQDYLLKQITSSLMYPESGLGKSFWDKIYERAQKEFGTTNIPVDTFNKVWIVPNEAVIYESGNTGFILKSHLKVMLEEDYLATSKNTVGAGLAPAQNTRATARVAPTKEIIRQIILPALEQEVNEGKNFAMLRQVFASMLLATWYKNVLKESFLSKAYADKAKIAGVDQDPKNNEEIYQQYLKAFKKGVFNYIKEDAADNVLQNKKQGILPRKYFAGGMANPGMASVTHGDWAVLSQKVSGLPILADQAGQRLDAAQAIFDPEKNRDKDAAMTWEDVKDQLPRRLDDKILGQIVERLHQHRMDIRYYEEEDKIPKAREYLKTIIVSEKLGAGDLMAISQRISILDRLIREQATNIIKYAGIIEAEAQRLWEEMIKALIKGFYKGVFGQEPEFVSPYGKFIQLAKDSPWFLRVSTGVPQALGGTMPRVAIIDLSREMVLAGNLPSYDGTIKINGTSVEVFQKDSLTSPLEYEIMRFELDGNAVSRAYIDDISNKYFTLALEKDVLNDRFIVHLRRKGSSVVYSLPTSDLNKAKELLKNFVRNEEGESLTSFKSVKDRIMSLGGREVVDAAMAMMSAADFFVPRSNKIVRVLKPNINFQDAKSYIHAALSLGDTSVVKDQYFRDLERITTLDGLRQYAEILDRNVMDDKREPLGWHIADYFYENVELGYNTGVYGKYGHRDAAMKSWEDVKYTLKPSISEEKIRQIVNQLDKERWDVLKNVQDFGTRRNRAENFLTEIISRESLSSGDLMAIANRISNMNGNFDRTGENANVISYTDIIEETAKSIWEKTDAAMPGGIDFNSSKFSLQIKRDAQGAPLEFVKQDMAQINNIRGFVPRILEIHSAINLPFLSELRQEVK